MMIEQGPIPRVHAKSEVLPAQSSARATGTHWPAHAVLFCLLLLAALPQCASQADSEGCGSDSDCATGRICDDGKCVDRTPTGSGGASGTGGTGSNPTGQRLGAACTRDGEVVCSVESLQQALQCENGTYQPYFTCPGLQPCRTIVGHDSIRCSAEANKGVVYAESGQPCANDEAAACSFDQQAILWCDSGVWTEAQHCPPSECTVSDSMVRCANGGISVGDRCRAETAGAVVCSTDLSKVLTCLNGTATVAEDCAQGSCRLVGTNTIDCVN